MLRPRLSTSSTLQSQARLGGPAREHAVRCPRNLAMDGYDIRPLLIDRGRLLLKHRVSDNAGAVNHFLSVLLRALRGARHFALVEAFTVALALQNKELAQSSY